MHTPAEGHQPYTVEAGKDDFALVTLDSRTGIVGDIADGYNCVLLECVREPAQSRSEHQGD